VVERLVRVSYRASLHKLQLFFSTENSNILGAVSNENKIFGDW